MSSKLTLKKDIVVRWVALLLAASLFSWVVGNLVDEPELIRVEDHTTWCFHAEYNSMDDYRDVKPPEMAFITFGAGDKVRVFERCDPFYER